LVEADLAHADAEHTQLLARLGVGKLAVEPPQLLVGAPAGLDEAGQALGDGMDLASEALADSPEPTHALALVEGLVKRQEERVGNRLSVELREDALAQRRIVAAEVGVEHLVDRRLGGDMLLAAKSDGGLGEAK
jgi:hypothetical protein